MTAQTDDETSISEISIAPNGRIYVFGASYEVLQVIEGLASNDSELHARLAHIRSLRNPASEILRKPAEIDHETAAFVKHAADQDTT